MKKLSLLFVSLTLLLNSLSAQITIGKTYSLASAPAPVLTRSIPVGGGYSAGFLARIGGVAFDQKAKPADGFMPKSVILNYVSENPNGKRLVVTIDDKTVNTELYDWQLLPIARFANSKDAAAFTLFGELSDAERQSRVLASGGRVLNYHRAFTDTLLGLRLLQVDTLLADREDGDLAVHLPMERGKYILGAGEAPSSLAANERSWRSFWAGVDKAAKTMNVKFASYVLGDREGDIRFSVEDEVLRVSGQPTYYFWNYAGESPGFNEDLVEKGIHARIAAEKSAARKSQGAAFDERAWLSAQVARVLGQFQHRGHLSRSVELLMAMPATQRLALLKTLSIDELNEVLEDARFEQAAMKTVHLKQFSEYVNARIESVREINPPVWDAAATVMRYAAFFRYCKEKSPESWQAFVLSIAKVNAQPALKTPTILQPTY